MGVWGYSAFENDDALDWVAELERSDSAAILADAFDVILESEGDYVELPEASIAIAAAEVLAGLMGQADPSLPEVVRAWIERQKQEEVDAVVIEKARRVINVVLTDSELQGVWEDAGNLDWKVCVERLVK
jgi:DNA-binding transcriptional regulator YbjK